MAFTLNPFPALRAFVQLEVQAARTAIRNMISNAADNIRSEVARAESSVKAYVEGAVGESEARISKDLASLEDRIVARLTGPAAPAPSLILPEPPAATRTRRRARESADA